MKALMVCLFIASLLIGSERFEIRWDGNLCTVSSDQNRQIVRKALREGSCSHPIGTQRQCALLGILNAEGAYYDGRSLTLSPRQPSKKALADFMCQNP